MSTKASTLLSDDFTYWSIITRTSFDKDDAAREQSSDANAIVETSTSSCIRCVNEGETVVVEGAGRRRPPTTASATTAPFVCIFETRDGLIMSMREYSDTRLAATVLPRFDV